MIICGDALTELRKLPDESVYMVLTDIPYGEVNHKSGGLRLLNRGIVNKCTIDPSELVVQITRIMRGSAYIFCGTMQISPIIESFRRLGLTTRLGVWDKTNPSPMNGDKLWLSGLEFCVFARKPKAVFNEFCKKALWESPRGCSKIHPTEKPMALLGRLIRASSLPGETVLDCFMGSGAVGIVAKELGRDFIGIELNAEYCKMAERRIAGVVYQMEISA